MKTATVSWAPSLNVITIIIILMIMMGQFLL